MCVQRVPCPVVQCKAEIWAQNSTERADICSQRGYFDIYSLKIKILSALLHLASSWFGKFTPLWISVRVTLVEILFFPYFNKALALRGHISTLRYRIIYYANFVKKKKKTGGVWHGAVHPSTNIFVPFITHYPLGETSCNFTGICKRSGQRVVVKSDCFPFLDSKLGSFDYFPKHACTHHHSVTVRDIWMQF